MNFSDNKFEKRNRNGFTLVELLMVMSIIAVLASLALVVIAEAQNDARRSATQARIGLLHSILQQRIESYEGSRLPIDVLNYLPSSDEDRRNARNLKRRVLTDIINVELPRTYLNIAFNPAIPNNPQPATYPSREFTQWVSDNSSTVSAEIIGDLAIQTPALARRFRRNASPLVSPQQYPEGQTIDPDEPITCDPSDPSTFPSLQIQTTLSEYLYQFLESSDFNGISPIESLGNRGFVDTDGDQFLEVVDSWGNPIFFQIEMYFDNGQPVLIGNSTVPVNLDSSLNLDDGAAVAVDNIRIRLISTGGNAEPITN